MTPTIYRHETHRRLLYTVPVDVWVKLSALAERDGQKLPEYVAKILEQHATQLPR